MIAHWLLLAIGAVALVGTVATPTQVPGDDALSQLLADDKPYHAVSEPVFQQFGWDLPDKGSLVKALADGAPGRRLRSAEARVAAERPARLPGEMGRGALPGVWPHRLP